VTDKVTSQTQNCSLFCGAMCSNILLHTATYLCKE